MNSKILHRSYSCTGRFLFFVFSLMISGFFPLSGNAAEPVAGDSCAVSGAFTHAGGPEQTGAGHFLVCNGSAWVSVIDHTASGRTDIQINNDTGSCTTAKTGRLRYNDSTDVWEYCTGSAWSPFEQAGSAVCNVFGQVPGYVCPDGTVFAGFPPNLYEPIFTTRCDAGQSWTGSCTGTRVTKPWNNGNSSGYVTTSQTGLGDGKANTLALSTGGAYEDSDSVTGGVQPHQAAQYCSDLVQDGHDDWYLPAISELYTMYVHRAAIGNFSTIINFGSSSEYVNSHARIQYFNNGTQSNLGKFSSFYVRCARRN